jgi:rhodanese-related sulfurtransferase
MMTANTSQRDGTIGAARRLKGSPAHPAALGLSLFAAVALALIPARALDPAAPSALEKTIADVAKNWPNVTHVPAADVARMMAEKSALVFDVRTPEEYAVSHLDGAIRVDPAIDAAAFLKEHGPAAKAKTAVFYCSVGVRSSKLTARVADGLKAAGAISTGEMQGGIFAWAGEGRPLVDAKGATDKVHGYDASWGKLVKRPETLETKERK